MSVASPIVATVADQWSEEDAARATSTLDEVLLASHLLGANRALANFGGGNTSAKGTATDHVGREVRAMWVKGSGSDLATMSAADFTPLRLDEIVPLLEARRDDRRGDGRLPGALPARPGGAAVLDRDAAARLHPRRARPPHPSRRDQRAGLRRRRPGADRGVLRRQRGLDRLHPPGFTLAKQVGEAVRANPELRLVVLAKHGLVVWGDTAQRGVRADGGGVQPGRRAGQRPQRPRSRASADPAAGCRPRTPEARVGHAARRSCPRCAARSPASAPRSCSPISRRRRASSSTPRTATRSPPSAPPAPITWSTPSACRCGCL